MRWIRVALVALPGLVLAGFALHHPAVLTPATARDWWTMHVLLIPVFPLLAVALGVLLRGDSGPLAWLARIAGYGYATFYTGLDVLAGIGAGLVVENDQRGSQNMLRLFEIGDQLGLAGAWMLLGCVVLTTVALGLRHGPWVVPGGLVLVVSGWFFRESHLFAPVGVYAMLGFAVGTALLAAAAPAADRSGTPATPPHAA